METSTPTNIGAYRNNQLIPDEDSPIYIGSPGLMSNTDDTVDQKSPTRLSLEVDQSKLTPLKQLTSSEEDKKLAGGAFDLSGARRQSRSLPNLSWENIDNCIFKPYPTRDKQHIARNRRHSLVDMEGIDVDGWSSGEFPSGEDNCISSVAGTESDKREKLVPIVDEKCSMCTQEIVKVGGASGVDENGSICTREFVELGGVSSSCQANTGASNANTEMEKREKLVQMVDESISFVIRKL